MKEVILVERPRPQAAFPSPPTPVPAPLAAPGTRSPKGTYPVSLRDLLGRQGTLTVPNGPTSSFVAPASRGSAFYLPVPVFLQKNWHVRVFLYKMYSASANACTCSLQGALPGARGRGAGAQSPDRAWAGSTRSSLAAAVAGGVVMGASPEGQGATSCACLERKAQ
ncbi:hypothetical protein mRhiFer1_009266 [Rhinolophus ferrumequinum]|uniref:Uncharacterized protein n=1 Tax=Rhinolophus ferrumequinum TaxID=59479 RepID=A0A7J7S827_RHIFE|nr:hypothetical protein mRhiFer1_009266 [Rhinolophus ferrumequinum]